MSDFTLKLYRQRTQRIPGAEAFTLGELYDEQHVRLCYTVEDEIRAAGEKVYGRTAIPAGKYKVTVEMSPRFKKELPRLQKVKGFEGILIHGGNRAEDSSGCIIVGMQRTGNGTRNAAPAVNMLITLIKANGFIWLEIIDPV